MINLPWQQGRFGCLRESNIEIAREMTTLEQKMQGCFAFYQGTKHPLRYYFLSQEQPLFIFIYLYSHPAWPGIPL
jgi:hypothetical protein